METELVPPAQPSGRGLLSKPTSVVRNRPGFAVAIIIILITIIIYMYLKNNKFFGASEKFKERKISKKKTDESEDSDDRIETIINSLNE